MWNFWVIFESFVAPSGDGGDGSHPHLSLGAAAAARTAGRVTQLRSHPIITSTVPCPLPSPSQLRSRPDMYYVLRIISLREMAAKSRIYRTIYLSAKQICKS